MEIRNGKTRDLESIASIEKEAAGLFSPEDLPQALRDECVPADQVSASMLADLTWVAVETSDRPVGFVVTEAFESSLHIVEMSVKPLNMRKGIGRSLVSTVLSAAHTRGFSQVTLTTFEHLPWNKPFYVSCGFSLIEKTELLHHLRKALLEEEHAGLQNRVAMRARV